MDGEGETECRTSPQTWTENLFFMTLPYVLCVHICGCVTDAQCTRNCAWESSSREFNKKETKNKLTERWRKCRPTVCLDEISCFVWVWARHQCTFFFFLFLSLSWLVECIRQPRLWSKMLEMLWGSTILSRVLRLDAIWVSRRCKMLGCGGLVCVCVCAAGNGLIQRGPFLSTGLK